MNITFQRYRPSIISIQWLSTEYSESIRFIHTKNTENSNVASVKVVVSSSQNTSQEFGPTKFKLELGFLAFCLRM